MRGLPGVACLGLTYLALVSVTPPGARDAVTAGGLAAIQFGAGVLMARRSIRVGGAEAKPWRYAAASAVTSSVIFVVWLVYALLGKNVPVPSAADVPFFAAVALQVVAVLSFQQRTASRADRWRLLLDGAIISISLLFVTWRLVIADAFHVAGISWAQAVVLTSYPLGDVIAVTGALLVATRVGASGRSKVLLFGLGMLALAAGDTLFGYLSAGGVWYGGHPATVLWAVGYPLMAVAMSRGHSAEVRRESATGARVLVLALMAPAIGALSVALAEDTVESLVIGSVLVALLLVRQTWSLFSEINARASLEEEVRAQTHALRVQAYRDPVTGLGNRALLRERAAQVAMTLETTALLLLDLDGFKEVNDSLGHATGDHLLLQVGDRLGGCVRSSDTVVRLGGDEFAVFLSDTGYQSGVVAAERILERLREPFPLDGTTVQVGGSIGIALGTSAADLDEMLRNADLAMYEVKAAGRDGARLFDAEMHERAVRRLQIDTQLRDAVANGELTVYYQPIVNAVSGEVTCLEALVRWDHPQRGVMPPSEFLPAAERTGLIVHVGRFVMRTACEQLTRWRQEWPELTMAVNVSPQELITPGFQAGILSVLSDTGLPTQAVHLEVTEQALSGEADISGVLRSLSALGVQFSIDDFGTGHSSLSRLRDLPVERLKIDKSFVTEIDDGKSAPLLSSIISLAHSLGRVVVAEGVESQQQSEYLIANRCDELQGYLFSRPVAAPHVRAILAGSHSTRAPSPSTTPSAFPHLIARIMDGTHPLETVMPALLRELTALSGLQCMFFTEVSRDPARQVTRYTHNMDPGALRIDEGLALDWSETLCRRMIEDDNVCETDVSTRYGDVEVAAALNIETYVTIPIHDSGGLLSGTLCAASSEQTRVDNTVVELMQVFAQALSARLNGNTAPKSHAHNHAPQH